MNVGRCGDLLAVFLILAGTAAAQPLDSTTRPGGPPGDVRPPFARDLLRHDDLQGSGCPLNFAQPTPPGVGCTFVGTWNKRCPTQALKATFVSDGRRVAVVLEEPFVYFVGGVGDGRDAPLRASGLKPDFSDARGTDGILSLSGSGSRLVITPAPAPFRLGGCDFLQYSGKFVPAADAAAARRAGRARALLGAGPP